MNNRKSTIEQISLALFKVLLCALLAIGLSPLSGIALESSTSPDAYSRSDDAVFEDNENQLAGESDSAEDSQYSREAAPGELIVIHDLEDSASDDLSEDIKTALPETSVESTEVLRTVDDESTEIVKIEIEDNIVLDEAIERLNQLDGVTAQPNYKYSLLESNLKTESGKDKSKTEHETDTRIISEEESNDSRPSYSDIESMSANSLAPLDSQHDSIIPNDTYFKDNTQYYLNDYISSNGSGASVKKAWVHAKANKNVTIAVIDTGCQYTHPDLKANIDTVHMKDVSNDRAPGIMLDGNGHGTHVCGIAAGVADNGMGIAGASYNAKILPIKIFDDAGEASYTSDIVNAYEYLDALIESRQLTDLRVVNMSLGSYGSMTSYDYAIQESIQELRDKHQVLTVCAGGNGDSNGNPITKPLFPSDLDNTLSVTSLTQYGYDSYWSDYNEYKDISAPGEDILSTYISTSPDKIMYAWLDGTSMASPLVAGIAALMFAAVPKATVSDVIMAIKSTAISLKGKANYRADTGSVGAIDADAAIEMLMNMHGVPYSSSSSDSDNSPGSSGSSTSTYKADLPKLSATSFTYDGKVHTVRTQGLGYSLISGPNSTISATNAGSYKVTARLATGHTWPDNTTADKTLTWQINPSAITSASLSSTSFVYDGLPKTPAITVKRSDGALIAYDTTSSNANVEITYPSARINVGSYTVVVKGRGNYAGALTLGFTINPSKMILKSVASVSKGMKVTWKSNSSATGYSIYRSTNGSSYVLAGTKAGKSATTFTDTKAKSNGKKYSYYVVATNTVGSVIYAGAGSEPIAGYFLSKPAKPKAKNTKGKKATVTWKKNSKASGYQIRYVTGKKAKTVSVTKAKTVKKVIKGLKKGKTYKVQVRAYKKVGSIKYFSEWSAKRSVKIRK